MIKIGKHLIGEGQPPFIIAEMSGNHQGDLDKALKLVEAAAKAGAHALKIQTYTADSITLDVRKDEFVISDPDSLWSGRSLYDLYTEAATPYEYHEPIFRKCKELGIECFSSPFDEAAVDFLEDLEVPCYKVASFENTDHILLKKVAQTGKPIIMSTGMSTLAEIGESVQVLKDNGCKDLILLKCTSAYPALASEANLNVIPLLKQNFPCEVGLSDHTLGLGVPLASVVLGAKVIEKHFCLSRDEGGVDSAFSLEPNELKDLVVESQKAFEALGSPYLRPGEREKKSKSLRRSLYIAKDMKAGEKLSEQNLRSVRPANGLEVKYYWTVLGKKVKADLPMGTPLSFDHLMED